MFKKKSFWLIVVLIILLTLITVYIGVKEYNKYIERVETKAYQQGMEDIILNMYEKGVNCQLIGLTTGSDNYVELISLDCLGEKQEE